MTPDQEGDERWWPSRYGQDDQLGTLNEIGPLNVVRAALLARQGQVFDLGSTLHAEVPHFPGRFWQQTLVSGAHLSNPRRPLGQSGGWGKNRVYWLTELVTGTLQIGTQLDGLNHLQIVDRCYNGWRTRDIVEDWGTSKLGIETVPPILTRALLIDAARRRGRGRLEAGDVITIGEVEAALKTMGVSVERGDAVLFHTGWGLLWDGDPAVFNAGEPGIGMEVAEWLVERRVALTGADTWSFGAVPGEDLEQPFLVPQTLNVEHGLFIMKNLTTPDAGRDRGRASAAADLDLPARPAGSASSVRTPRAVPDRPTLARLHPVPRVLPRRHRRGPRRQPPDRLDRPGDQAARPAG